VIARGRVQGVFFRASLERLATERGVAGSARNRDDGSVEAIFEGPPDAVDELIAFAAEGPRDADVSHLDVTEEEPEGLLGFSTA
jgi:acylphosphatase